MSIIGHWTFDNVSGVNVYDDVGMNDGVLTNITVNASGKFDDCVYTTGVSASRYMLLTSNASFKSASFWGKRVVDSTNDMSSMLLAPSASLGLKALVAGRTLSYSDAILINNTDSGHVVSDSLWHHYVITEGSSNNHHWVWVDGVKSATEFLSNFGGLIWGVGIAGVSTSWSVGGIDNLQIYNHVLSTLEVAELFAKSDQTSVGIENNIAVSAGFSCIVKGSRDIDESHIAIALGFGAIVETKAPDPEEVTLNAGAGFGASIQTDRPANTIKVGVGLSFQANSARFTIASLRAGFGIGQLMDARTPLAAVAACRLCMGCDLEADFSPQINLLNAFGIASEIYAVKQINDATITLSLGFCTTVSTQQEQVACRLPEYSTARWA